MVVGEAIRCLRPLNGVLAFGLIYTVTDVNTTNAESVTIGLTVAAGPDESSSSRVIWVPASAVRQSCGSYRLGILADQVDCHHRERSILVVLSAVTQRRGMDWDPWYICRNVGDRVTVVCHPSCFSEPSLLSIDGNQWPVLSPVWSALLDHLCVARQTIQ